MKLTQKGLVLTVALSTLLVAGGLVAVAWFYRGKLVNTPVSTNTNSLNSKVGINTNLNTNTNTNTNVKAVTIVSTIDPTNGKDFVPDGWQNVELSGADSSGNVPHNNLADNNVQTFDSIVSPFDKERYYIKRDGQSTYCGPNGETSTCDLIRVKKDGSTQVIGSLWFPEKIKTSEGTETTVTKSGAKLIKFINAQTLQLYFGAGDHGGGYSEISNYSLVDHSLTSQEEYIQSEGSDPGAYTILSYSIIRGGKKLIFINYNARDGSELDGAGEGVFLYSNANDVKKLNFPKGPYSVIFNLQDNTTGDVVNLTVNGIATQVNLKEATFQYSNAVSNANWNTYTDSKSGLTIQYPKDWVAVDTAYASKGFRPASSKPTDNNWSAIYVNFRPNTQMLELEEFYNKATNFENLYKEATSHEQRVIDGMLVTYLETIPGAVANSALVASLGIWVVELQMHKDQIGVIDNMQNIFFSMFASLNAHS